MKTIIISIIAGLALALTGAASAATLSVKVEQAVGETFSIHLDPNEGYAGLVVWKNGVAIDGFGNASNNQYDPYLYNLDYGINSPDTYGPADLQEEGAIDLPGTYQAVLYTGPPCHGLYPFCWGGAQTVTTFVQKRMADLPYGYASWWSAENWLESHGLRYRHHHVNIDWSSCIGLRRLGVSHGKFQYFKCIANTPRNHFYHVWLHVTKSDYYTGRVKGWAIGKVQFIY